MRICGVGCLGMRIKTIFRLMYTTDHLTLDEYEENTFEDLFLSDISYEYKPKAFYYGDDAGRAE